MTPGARLTRIMGRAERLRYCMERCGASTSIHALEAACAQAADLRSEAAELANELNEQFHTRNRRAA